jgi:hypothetical protein
VGGPDEWGKQPAHYLKTPKVRSFCRGFCCDSRTLGTQATETMSAVVCHVVFADSPESVDLMRTNTYLVRWIRKKYKRYRGLKRALQAWTRATTHYPRFFVHWASVTTPLPVKMMGAG